MDDRQLERYSRHILTVGIDLQGQHRLLKSTVMLVGVGGLGSPVAMYLAASGVGHIILNDHDHVDLGNLQRQVAHTTADLNRLKVESARDRLLAMNPDVRITTIGRCLTETELEQHTRQADVVIDASDNFITRYALNSACVMTKTPLVWGAAIRFEGQATTFMNSHDENPCLNCLFPASSAFEGGESCGGNGVFAPLPGIIGSIMAAEALKVLLELGMPLSRRLLQIDARGLEWRQSNFSRDPDCEICSQQRPLAHKA